MLSLILDFELNSNKLFLRTNSAILIMSSAGMVLSINLSYWFRDIFKLSSWGILGYNPTTSAVTRINHLEILPIAVNSSRKASICLIYEFLYLVRDCKPWSKNPETYSSQFSQFFFQCSTVQNYKAPWNIT